MKIKEDRHNLTIIIKSPWVIKATDEGCLDGKPQAHILGKNGKI